MDKRVVALGFFDGVHLGHGSLLRRAREEADRLGCLASVITFDTQPSSVITGKQVPLISSREDRAYLMRTLYGVDEVEFLHFGRSLMELPWEDFLRICLLQERNAVHVVCGADYRFGYRGEGNAEKLQSFCTENGIGLDVMPELSLNGIPVHSTKIRELLLSGDLSSAEALLGHPHLISGRVISGKQLGRTIGAPTANLAISPEVLCPSKGVYVALAEKDGVKYPAVANVGVCPTVSDGGKLSLEAFLLDYSGDLYGAMLHVSLLQYLRPERRFPSVAALQEAIRADAEQARAYFAAHPQN